MWPSAGINVAFAGAAAPGQVPSHIKQTMPPAPAFACTGLQRAPALPHAAPLQRAPILHAPVAPLIGRGPVAPSQQSPISGLGNAVPPQGQQLHRSAQLPMPHQQVQQPYQLQQVPQPYAAPSPALLTYAGGAQSMAPQVYPTPQAVAPSKAGLVCTGGAATAATVMPQALSRGKVYLPDVASSLAEPVSFMLDVIEQRGLLLTPGVLQPDADDVVHINLPFCYALQECRLLAEFVDRAVVPHLPESTKVRMYGTDIVKQPHMEWDRKERWVRENFSRIELSFTQSDLSREELPPAQLTLGFHPEVNGARKAEWVTIIQNVLRSAARGGGICVFAHILQREVRRMLDICAGEGVDVQVILNPCYEGVPEAETETSTLPMYYLLVACPRRGVASDDVARPA